MATKEIEVTTKKFPVVEVFGPTIQGEGIDQGIPCYFIRFGGCDFHCSWCDSPHAVLAEYVRRAERLDTETIIARLKALHTGPRLVVLSGGNPLLHDLSHLVDRLHEEDYKISVETQGTKFRTWLWKADRIAISPKPPSSGHLQELDKIAEFVKSAEYTRTPFLKIVVLDLADYEFARKVHQRLPEIQMYLSACNDAGPTVAEPTRKDDRTPDEVARALINRGRRLVNWTMLDPEMADVRVQVQNHVLYWGNERAR